MVRGDSVLSTQTFEPSVASECWDENSPLGTTHRRPRDVSLRISHLVRRESVPVVGIEPTAYPLPAGGPGRIRTDDDDFADRRLSPLGDGAWQAWKELNPRSQVWSLVDHHWLTPWLPD